MGSADATRRTTSEVAPVRRRASVIVALGASPLTEGIDSWRTQTVPADDFEIVVVAAAMTKSVEDLQERLRPHDALVVRDEVVDTSLYDLGVAASSGRVIVLTHDRMLAEPDCLLSSLARIEGCDESDGPGALGADAAMIHWGTVSRDAVDLYERLLDEQQMRDWPRVDPLQRVRSDGFVTTRSAYDAAGGWDVRYGPFSAALLAARLHRNGIDVQLVGSRPLVRRLGARTLRQTAVDVRDRIRGEFDFVADRSDPDIAVRYTTIAADLASSIAFPAAIREMESRIDPSPEGRMAADAPPPPTMPGGVGERVSNGLARAATRARLRLVWSESARLHAYVRYRELTDQRWRRPLLRRAAATYSAVLDARQGTVEFEATDLSHLGPMEFDRGIPFRWSAPVATHRLALAPGDWALHFDTGSIRGAADGLDVALYWNGEPVPVGRVSRNTAWISAVVTADGGRSENWLTTVLPPLATDGPSSDSRRLGLPLRRIRVEAADAGTIDADGAPVCPVSETRPPAPPVTDMTAVLNPAAGPSTVLLATAVAPTTKVLLVNTSDLGGGAEVITTALQRGYRRHGLDSWLVVGDKKASGDGSILSMFASPLVDYASVQTIRSHATTAARRALGRRFGAEDFEWPQTTLLDRMTGAPPDVLHLHNLHGGYFDLRRLPELSQARPTFLTLHDEWSYTGHCAYAVECDRWERHCGKCPALDAPPAVARDATRFNHGRKAGIYERSRLFIGSPSAWLMARAERSVLAPAIVESRVIPNGIDLRVFRPGSQSVARRQLGLPATGFVSAFAASAGSETSYKGFATLRASFVRLAALAGPEIHLVTAGRELADERIGRLTIHHLPRLTHPDMAQLYRASDLYVHAARAEAHGLVILEAMACGTPIVATRVGGTPEAVTDGEHGLLVADGDHVGFADSVERFMNDPALRSRMGDAARTRAQRDFDEVVMVRRYIDWFDDVLHSPSPPRSPAHVVPEKASNR